MAKLEVEYVSAIERSPSGKRRYFVDRLHTDPTESNDQPQDSQPDAGHEDGPL
jgi:hypothetical protein